MRDFQARVLKMYYEVKPMVALLIKKLTADCLWLLAPHSAGNAYILSSYLEANLET